MIRSFNNDDFKIYDPKHFLKTANNQPRHSSLRSHMALRRYDATQDNADLFQDVEMAEKHQTGGEDSSIEHIAVREIAQNRESRRRLVKMFALYGCFTLLCIAGFFVGSLWLYHSRFATSSSTPENPDEAKPMSPDVWQKPS